MIEKKIITSLFEMKKNSFFNIIKENKTKKHIL